MVKAVRDLELWERGEWMMEVNGDLHCDWEGEPLNLLGLIMRMSDDSYRHVAQTTIMRWGLTISTVWLGVNMSFGRGRPICFETMVFMDFLDDTPGRPLHERAKEYQDMAWRHHTHDEALLEHGLIVQGVMTGKNYEEICDVLYESEKA